MALCQFRPRRFIRSVNGLEPSALHGYPLGHGRSPPLFDETPRRRRFVDRIPKWIACDEGVSHLHPLGNDDIADERAADAAEFVQGLAGMNRSWHFDR